MTFGTTKNALAIMDGEPPERCLGTWSIQFVGNGAVLGDGHGM